MFGETESNKMRKLVRKLEKRKNSFKLHDNCLIKNNLMVLEWQFGILSR